MATLGLESYDLSDIKSIFVSVLPDSLAIIEGIHFDLSVFDESSESLRNLFKKELPLDEFVQEYSYKLGVLFAPIAFLVKAHQAEILQICRSLTIKLICGFDTQTNSEKKLNNWVHDFATLVIYQFSRDVLKKWCILNSVTFSRATVSELKSEADFSLAQLFSDYTSPVFEVNDGLSFFQRRQMLKSFLIQNPTSELPSSYEDFLKISKKPQFPLGFTTSLPERKLPESYPTDIPAPQQFDLASERSESHVKISHQNDLIFFNPRKDSSGNLSVTLDSSLMSQEQVDRVSRCVDTFLSSEKIVKFTGLSDPMHRSALDIIDLVSVEVQRHAWTVVHRYFLLTGLLDRNLVRRVLPLSIVQSSVGFKAACDHVEHNLRVQCTSQMQDDRLTRLRDSLTPDLTKETISEFLDRCLDYFRLKAESFQHVSVKEGRAIIRAGLSKTVPLLYSTSSDILPDVSFDDFILRLRQKEADLVHTGQLVYGRKSSNSNPHPVARVHYGGSKQRSAPKVTGEDSKQRVNDRWIFVNKEGKEVCGRCFSPDHGLRNCKAIVIYRAKDRCLVCGDFSHKTSDCRVKSTCFNCGTSGHMTVICSQPIDPSKFSKPPTRSNNVRVMTLSAQLGSKPASHPNSDNFYDPKINEEINILLSDSKLNLETLKPVCLVPPTFVTVRFYFPRTGKYIDLKAQIDDGADVDLMSMSIARSLHGTRFDADISGLNECEPIYMGNGKPTYSFMAGYNAASITIPATGNEVSEQSVFFVSEYYAVEGLPVDFLLSRVSLAKAGISLSFTPNCLQGKSPVIRLNCKLAGISLSSRPNWFSSPEIQNSLDDQTISTVDFVKPSIHTASSDSENSIDRVGVSSKTSSFDPLLAEALAAGDFYGSSKSYDDYLKEVNGILSEMLDFTKQDAFSFSTSSFRGLSFPLSDPTIPTWCSINDDPRYSLKRVVASDHWTCLLEVIDAKTSGSCYWVDIRPDVVSDCIKLSDKLRTRGKTPHKKEIDSKLKKGGIEKLQQMLADGKLIPASDSISQDILFTNYYTVSSSSGRVRPVFPLLLSNSILRPKLEQTNFNQDLLQNILLRIRCFNRISSIDIDDAFMQIRVSPRTSTIFGLFVPDGLSITNSDSTSLHHEFVFTRAPYGSSVSPFWLERVVHDCIDKFARAIEVSTVNDIILPETPFSVGNFMDDVITMESPFKLSTSTPAPDPEFTFETLPWHKTLWPKATVINSTLLMPLLVHFKSSGCPCTDKKITELSSSEPSEGIGILFLDSDKMQYKRLRELLDYKFPTTLTYRDVLGFTAKLAPLTPELVSPFSILLKNTIQQIVGIEVANILRPIPVPSSSDRKNAWDSTVSGSLSSFTADFHAHIVNTSDYYCLRGLDISRALILITDASCSVVGYKAAQVNLPDDQICATSITGGNIRVVWYSQRLIRRLSKLACHINNKEMCSMVYAIIDCFTRFEKAKISLPPRLICFSDNKKTISTFKNGRPSDSADPVQTLLMTRLLTQLQLCVGERFLRERCTFMHVPGNQNISDSLTRSELLDKMLTHVVKIAKPSDTSISDFSDSEPEEHCVPRYIPAKSTDPTETATAAVTSVMLHTLGSRTGTKPESLKPGASSSVVFLPPIFDKFFWLRKIFISWSKFSTSSNLSDPILLFEGSLSWFINLQSELHEYVEGGPFLEITNEGLLTSNGRIVVPDYTGLRDFLINHVHTSCGHPKSVITSKILSSTCSWKGMSKQVKTTLKFCVPCQATNRDRVTPHPAAVDYTPPMKIWQRIAIDIYGPITPLKKTCTRIQMKTAYSNSAFPTYFLSSIDYLSGFCSLIPIYTAEGCGPSSADVWNATLLLFQLFGWPSQVVYDSGTNLVPLARYFAAHGVQPLILPANAEWRRGRVERSHRSLTDCLRCAFNSSTFRPFDALASLYGRVQAINLTSSDGISPADLFFGFTPSISGLQSSTDTNLSFIESLKRIGFDNPTIELLSNQAAFNQKRSVDLIKSATELLKGRRSKNRKNIENRARLRRSFEKIEIDSLVYAYRKPASKLDSSWRGPLQVVHYNELTDEFLLSDGTLQTPSNLKLAFSVETFSKPSAKERAKISSKFLKDLPIPGQVCLFDDQFFRIDSCSHVGVVEMVPIIFSFDSKTFFDISGPKATSDSLSIEIIDGVRFSPPNNYQCTRNALRRIISKLEPKAGKP
jgi:hypothetical protein